MMISPDSFVNELKDKSYKELLIEREKLLKSIYAFEKESDDDNVDIGGCVSPSPDVVYQVELQYLGELCKLIAEKYNKEYIWNIE